MKRFILLFLCGFMTIPVFTQTKFHSLTLEQALERARDENKYVFVDCYTSWCEPCKVVADKILPLEEVGAFMNGRFVCVKFDMEKGEGRDIAKAFQVTSFPTFLVLKEDGSVLHRFTGGAPTGGEFIKKVKEGLNEDVTRGLEEEYVAGNRNLDFLMTYIKALVRVGEAGKAEGITRGLLASLTDEEKCSAPFWYIYQSRELSPIGSENLAYLLRNAASFREGVGMEKVDAVLGALFETELEDIIRGLSNEVSLADMEAAEQSLESYHLTGQEHLAGYIHLIKALINEDTDETLSLYKKLFPGLPDEKIVYLYFTPLTRLKEKWSKQQKEEIGTLSKQLSDKVQSNALKNSLKQFAREVSRRW